MDINECRSWLDCLVRDAREKLGLSPQQIILILNQKIGELILEELIRKGGEDEKEK